MARNARPTINNYPELLARVDQIELAARLRLILDHLDKITSVERVLYLLRRLSGPDAAMLILAHEVKKKITNLNDVIRILDFLAEKGVDEELWVEIASSHRAKIQGMNELIRVLEALPQANRLAFAKLCQDKIQKGNELVSVLWALPDAKRLDFAERCQAKIQKGNELVWVLKALPQEKRLDFATLCQAKIQGMNELIRVLEALPEAKREEFAKRCQAKIQNGNELARVLEALPKANRLAFAQSHQAKIENGDQLAGVLCALPTENRLAFAQRYQAKIENGDQLSGVLYALLTENRLDFAQRHQAKIENGRQLSWVLKALPEETRLAFARENKNKIKNIYEFYEVIVAIERNSLTTPLTPDEKRRLAEGCCSAVRVAYSLREKNNSRDLFNDSGVQQLIALQKVDANAFLFAAAVNPASDADFDYFLNHSLCSVTALNERGENLVLFIEKQESLSPEIKTARIARVKAAQESQRQAISRQTIGFNLGSIKETASTFSGALPEAVGVDWTVPGVDAAEITRFGQLIQWLKSQPVLASFCSSFSALETKEDIRTSALFKRSAETLETFVAELAHYLEKNPASTADDEARLKEDLSLRLEASEQLGACAEGALNALQAMTRSLNSSASIAMVADTALDRAIMSFIALTGIPKNMEVHTSKDRLLGLLGLDSTWHYDAYRLPISPVYLQAIARNAMGRLTPDYLISQSVPSLESLTATSLRFNAEGRALLERDWQVLYSTGLLTEYTNEGSAKWVAVMRFINSAMTEGQAEEIKTNWADVEIARDLTVETLSARYQTLLESKGILTPMAEKMSVIKTGIWRLLTSEDSTPTLNALLATLLKAPNGLNLIKEVIDSHTPAEQSQIRLSTLLRCPEGFSTNIFRSFTADPYFAGWMMGWQFSAMRTPAGSVLGFAPALSCPLANVVAQLAANETLMHKELEEIFMLPGNLLFWLGELQKDPQRHTTFTGIMSFLSAQPLYQFDNVLAVLDKMMSAEDELQRTTAKSFLEARCAEQKSQGLWHCYWKTASYIDGFAPDFLNKDLLLSLKDPANARAAVFLSQSKQELFGKILQAHSTRLVSQGECAAIIKTIQALYPPSTPAAGIEAVSPPTDDDQPAASVVCGPR